MNISIRPKDLVVVVSPGYERSNQTGTVEAISRNRAAVRHEDNVKVAWDLTDLLHIGQVFPQNEYWRKLHEFRRYSISTHGRVRNDTTAHIIKLGYAKNRPILQISVYLNGHKRTVTRYVNRLLWQTFYGVIPDGYSVVRIDQNRLDPCVTNLALISSPGGRVGEENLA